jgi:hypothetical protein
MACAYAKIAGRIGVQRNMWPGGIHLLNNLYRKDGSRRRPGDYWHAGTVT